MWEQAKRILNYAWHLPFQVFKKQAVDLEKKGALLLFQLMLSYKR